MSGSRARQASPPGLLEGTFSSVRLARHALAALPMGPDARERTTLVLSELGTNAVVHGGGAFTLRLWYTRDWARVEVQDASARMPEFPRGAPSDRDVGGRGLLIVEALATFVGAERKDSGKVVWAEVGHRPSGWPAF